MISDEKPRVIMNLICLPRSLAFSGGEPNFLRHTWRARSSSVAFSSPVACTIASPTELGVEPTNRRRLTLEITREVSPARTTYAGWRAVFGKGDEK